MAKTEHKTSFTLGVIASIKRKNWGDLIANLCKIDGNADGEALAIKTSRFTVGTIDKIMLTTKEGYVQSADKEDVVKKAVEEAVVEHSDNTIRLIEDVENAIKKGKYKKAKKALTTLQDSNISGTGVDKLVKQVKALKGDK